MRIEKNKISAVQYVMNYKDNTEMDWTGKVWDLMNTKNNYRNSVLQCDVRQGGNDGYGFYPNYIVLTVRKDCDIDFDGYLESLGYNFKKQDVTVLELIAEWDEDYDEVVVDWDI